MVGFTGGEDAWGNHHHPPPLVRAIFQWRLFPPLTIIIINGMVPKHSPPAR